MKKYGTVVSVLLCHSVNSLCVQKKAEAEQLLQEQKDYELELERREKMREEAARLAEIEAERRKVGVADMLLSSA